MLFLLGFAAAAHAGTIVSYGVAGGQPSAETFGGTDVRPVDLVDLASANLVFGAFPDSPPEDVDAAHVRANGNVVFSTSTDVTQGFGGLSSFKNGDVIEYNPGTGVADVLFAEDLFGANQNVDAFSILPNGHFLLSTDLTSILDGQTFLDGDVIEFDPTGGTASLFMGLNEATIFTGTNQDIDALFFAEGSLVLSLRSNGVGSIGSLAYVPADEISNDLVTLDPTTLDASLLLDGTALFDGATRNIDAVFLPEPSTLSLLGLGLIGLVASPPRHS